MASQEDLMIPCVTPDQLDIVRTSIPLPTDYAFVNAMPLSSASSLTPQAESPSDWMDRRAGMFALYGGQFNHIAVAHIPSDTVIGTASVLVHNINTFGCRGKFAGLYGLFVDPQHRNVGVGYSIVGQTLAVAESAAPNVYVDSLSIRKLGDLCVRLGMRRTGTDRPALIKGAIPILARTS